MPIFLFSDAPLHIPMSNISKFRRGIQRDVRQRRTVFIKLWIGEHYNFTVGMLTTLIMPDAPSQIQV
jgi:hypothetical protein